MSLRLAGVASSTIDPSLSRDESGVGISIRAHFRYQNVHFIGEIDWKFIAISFIAQQMYQQSFWSTQICSLLNICAKYLLLFRDAASVVIQKLCICTQLVVVWLKALFLVPHQLLLPFLFFSFFLVY